jgi:hypothetical protein
MRRIVFGFIFVVFFASANSNVSADVRSDQRVKFQLGGAIGKLVNIFGGKGAREGVTSIVAVKGNRKATMSDSTGQIIDLSEEKVYDLDIKKKTYKVTTFAEMREEMEKARREAEQSARDMPRDEPSEPSKPAQKDPNQKEVEVDFDVKNTGATKKINGFDTRQSIVTITVREKGKTLDEAGGMVMTTDMWLAPSAPSTKELMDFDMRYAQKLYGRDRRVRAGHGHGHGDVSAGEAGARQDARRRRQDRRHRDPDRDENGSRAARHRQHHRRGTARA